MPLSTSTHADGQLYQYSELSGANTFRILRLNAQDADADPLQGPITGALCCASLDDYEHDGSLDKYDAMSYCWGDPTPVDRIWLTETTHLPISASAAYILRHYKGPRHIWIDSVCINQSDHVEKARQVSMMWDIFSRAEIVLVWLGDPRDDARLAMNLIFDIVQPLPIPFDSERRPIFLHKLYPTESDHFHEPSWAALSKLLDRPWFRRVWIIQEAVAASEIVLTCADQYLLWDHFVEFLEKLKLWNCQRLIQLQDPDNPLQRGYFPRGSQSIQRIQSLRQSRKAKGQKPSLEWSLSLAINTEAQDPRDKLFAILSFSDVGSVPDLRPRYDASVCDVYTDATRYILTHKQSLTLLHLAGIGWNRPHAELPSWVPDYSRVRCDVQSGKSSHIHANTLSQTLRFTESGLGYYTQTSEVKSFKSVPHAISIRGLIEDTILLVCQGLPLDKRMWKRITSNSHSERLNTVMWFNKMFKEVDAAARSCHSASRNKSRRSLSTSDAFWHALAVGLAGRDSWPSLFGIKESRKEFNAFLALLLYSAAEKDEKLDLDGLDPERLRLAMMYVEALEQVQDWSVFVTRKGYVGRGPPLMEKGDHVCIFLGARTPFIVRRAYPNWISRILPVCLYELVGECYVQGLMRSEAIIDREHPFGPIGAPLLLI